MILLGSLNQVTNQEPDYNIMSFTMLDLEVRTELHQQLDEYFKCKGQSSPVPIHFVTFNNIGEHHLIADFRDFREITYDSFAFK